MKRIIGTTALASLLALGVLAPLAGAQCTTGTGTNILLKWDANGFSYETGTPYANYVSTAGNVLTEALAADLLCSPMAALDPNDPANEYTMVWTGLVSTGTVVAPFGSSGHTYTTIYLGGTFSLYQGPVNARAWTNLTVPPPSLALPSYTDGTVILSGTLDTLTTLVTTTGFGTTIGSFRGSYRATGGTYASQLCGGSAVAALLDGLWYPDGPPAGWTSQNNGKFDAPHCVTPAINSSWGRIKAIYH